MKIFKVLALIVMFMALTIAASAQINVSGSTGADGSYTTLSAAFTAINGGVQTGNTISITVTGDTTEPAGGAVLNAGAWTSITISPSGGAARTITGAATAGSPLIDFNGADNVTVNGLNTGGDSLTIANTTVSATSGTSTIRFIGGATNNTITNSNIQGSGTMSVATNGAVIFFSTDALTANGNDNNTISNNNIGPAGANLPTKGILGNGSTTTTAIGNSGIVINNNNIFDFFGAAVTSSGVVTNGGCNTWTITNNRFYQTGTRTWTTGASHRAIDINTSTATSGAQAFTITGNTIGYASNTQTGTYTLTGSNGSFRGISFNGITGATVTNINNNTIANISMSGVTSNGTSTGSPFMGIFISNGLVNTNNNTIGNLLAINSLVVSTTTATSIDVFGIFNFSVDDWTANGNNIGGISLTNAGTSTTSLHGMRANTSTAKVFNADQNIIGGPIGNSLQVTSTGTTSQVIGMTTFNAISTWTRNTVRNMTNNGGTGTSASASVIGMNFTSTTPNHTIRANTITGLTNTNATLATVITGIQYTGGTGANVVERNLIGDFFSSTTSATAEVNGIRVAGGTTVYRNNMIYLGAGVPNAIGSPATNGGTTGVNGINEFLGTNTFVHNSVYIGGNPTAGTGASFAFNGSQTINTRSFRNNIFFNGRGNAGATGSNYAVKINGTAPNPTGLTINNNMYFANGSGGVFGFFNALDVANLAAWQTAVGQDVNSFEANPLYVSTTDLHLQAASPARDQAANLGVTNDFDNDSRPGLNALFDIGADEFDGIPPIVNDIQATAFIDPSNGGSKLQGANFAPQASFTNNGTANQTNVLVRYRICQDVGCTTVLYNNTAIIPTLNSLATTNVTFPTTSIATPGVYMIKATAELGTDTVPANDEITGTLNIQAPLSGTYSVGSGGNYPSLTNPGGMFEAINSLGASANLVINITSDLSGETGAVALNELAGGFTVLIKPSGGPRIITGSSTTSIIRFNAADNVRIDGWTGASLFDGLKSDDEGDSFVGGNPNLRELTIENTSTGTSSAVISIQSGANGASNNTLRNLNIDGQAPTTTLIGISIGGNGNGIVATQPNNNNRVENVRIRRANTGIYNAGVSAVSPNTGSIINENDITATGADRVRRLGILVFNHDGIQITDNSVGGMDSNESADAVGIGVGTQNIDTLNVTNGGIVNALVARNRVNGVNSNATAGFSASGITIAGGTTGSNLITNNLISGVISNSTSPDFPVGIFVAGVVGSNTRIIYNSISMTGDRGATATQMPSYGIAITGTDPTVELKNNIFYTTQTASGGGAGAETYAVGLATATFVNLDSNFNAFWSTGANDSGFRSGSLALSAGTDYIDLAAWQTAISDDASSVEVDPLFFNDLSNLHLNPASPVRNIGTPIAGITNDHDNETRPNPLDALVVQVDIGGDESYAPTAANASVEGQVLTADGAGIRNATVIITGGGLTEPRYVTTGSFGKYRFEDLPVGETYIISVNSRRFVFTNPTMIVTLDDNVSGLNFTAEK